MRPAFTGSPCSIRLQGQAIPEATDQQRLIPGFDQEAFSHGRILCIGAGGLISHIAPTLVRKGIGQITLVDHDIVEPSNLNRQRFYTKDVRGNKAVALAENLVPECIVDTEVIGHPFRFEEAVARGLDLSCDAAICGVDNNPARVAASRYFRAKEVPVVFAAVSRNGDHGYVFVQEATGPCIGCLFPDIGNDDRYPCPGTPAIADILQSVGSLVVYAIDTLLTRRSRAWNYRRITLSDGSLDSTTAIPVRQCCKMWSVQSEEKESKEDKREKERASEKPWLVKARGSQKALPENCFRLRHWGCINRRGGIHRSGSNGNAKCEHRPNADQFALSGSGKICPAGKQREAMERRDRHRQ